MDVTVLGKRIKEARLAKKMTQSDVVGTYITRNMLSQIESGAALPSIRTLEYLSDVLEIPMSEIMAAEDDGFSGNSALLMLTCLTDAKKDFLNGCFERAIETLSPYLNEKSPLYDESAAVIFRARMKLAEKYDKDGKPEAAAKEREAVRELKNKGIYQNN